jgi:hypothetical protein
MDRLTALLKASAGSRTSDPQTAHFQELRWPVPPTPEAALLLAESFLELPIDDEVVQSISSFRGTLELAVGKLASWLSELVRRSSSGLDEQGELLIHALAAQRAAQLYVRFRKYRFHRSQGVLLQVLFASRVPTAVSLGVDLLVEQPPFEWSDSSLALSALMQSPHQRVEDVFPRILDATSPAVLAPALDIANHLCREKGVYPHPAAPRFDALLSLLGAVTQQLASLEENPGRYSDRVSEIQRMLFDGVSLAVSLCHFFALQGDVRAIGKLTQALDLGHRRIKAEAAFALARLGEDRAVDLLLQLMQDDASRPRVMQYAKELGIEERIEPEWCTPLAHAKSQLALWLSQPEQFSLAPQHIELVEHRTLPWPGMDQPQDCFLLRFEYALGNAHLTSIGFAGPYAFAFPFETSGLTNDELFSMFMAQDIEDPNEVSAEWGTQNSDQQHHVEAWLERLEEVGYQALVVKRSLEFLGRSAVVAHAMNQQGQEVCILVDSEEWLACDRSVTSVDYLRAKWKGRLAREALNL